MAKLNDEIANIEKGSALETMYYRLLAGLEAASQETIPDFTGPDYMEDGVANEAKINAEIKKYADITRKNSAYLLANATVSSVGGSEGNIKGAVAITGDSMTGKLNTLYGFAAGDNGTKILEVCQLLPENEKERHNVVSIDGELHLNAHGFYLNDRNVLHYDTDTLSLDAERIELHGDISCSGILQLGELVISKDGIRLHESEFYHSGNCNQAKVDWSMYNGTVAGDLSVKGSGTFRSAVTALGGVDLGFGNVSILSLTAPGTAKLAGNLNIVTGGIQFNDDSIIHIKNANVVSFSASNKVLNLGDDGTIKINLQSGIYDDDGEYELVSKFGAACFPVSFQAGHGLGNTLIATYKASTENSGIVIHRHLKFKDADGPGFYSKEDTVCYEALFRYQTSVNGEAVSFMERKSSSVGYIESPSVYAPLNRVSASLQFTTEADFYVFDKPLEGRNSIGIAGSKTRILENELFFNDDVYWLALGDGIKHYGNAYLVNDIGSVSFSSGFAGNGWKIFKNKLTGNVCATFDEVTVRKRMRLYELEVQKQSATNGSLWISDACSGDLVEEIR